MKCSENSLKKYQYTCIWFVAIDRAFFTSMKQLRNANELWHDVCFYVCDDHSM